MNLADQEYLKEAKVLAEQKISTATQRRVLSTIEALGYTLALLTLQMYKALFIFTISLTSSLLATLIIVVYLYDLRLNFSKSFDIRYFGVVSQEDIISHMKVLYKIDQ